MGYGVVWALLMVGGLLAASLWLGMTIGPILHDNRELYDDFGAPRPLVRKRMVRRSWVLATKILVVMAGYYVVVR